MLKWNVRRKHYYNAVCTCVCVFNKEVINQASIKGDVGCKKEFVSLLCGEKTLASLKDLPFFLVLFHGFGGVKFLLLQNALLHLPVGFLLLKLPPLLL